MKTLLCVVVFASLVYLAHSAATKELSSRHAAAKKACEERFKESYDTVEEEYKSGKEPSHDSKCMAACFMDRMGYVKDGKLDLDAVKELGKLKYPDDENNREKAERVAMICSEKVPENDSDCEYAHSLVTCFLAEAKKVNLDEAEYEDGDNGDDDENDDDDSDGEK